MTTLLNYPGAKWGMAKQIVDMMPPHRSYLEPFFGSGAVLFNKKPSAIETVNDLDDDICNFFRVLQQEPERLAEAISMTPYARTVFNDAHANRGTDDFDKAVRFAIRSKMGHGFKTYQKTGFKVDVFARERSYCVDCWNRMPTDLLEAAKRLKYVQIENKQALELIKRFNHDNVLIYADPPYMMETRSGKQYRCEMTDRDHEELLDALVHHKGFVILSGYRSELYHDILGSEDWYATEIKAYNQNADQRTEVLWTNFQPPGEQLSLFGREKYAICL